MLANELGLSSVLDVVARTYQLEGTQRGDEFEMLCPHPAHDDRTPSASVNLTTGLWHCFSCGRGGDIVGLGTLALEKTRAEVEDFLKPNTPEALLAILRGRMHRVRRKKQTELVLPPVGGYPDGPLTSLLNRGFSLGTLRRWDVRYVPSQTLPGKQGDFNIYSSIGMPVMDERHRLLFWCYRRTDSSPDWQPRYLLTPGAEGLVKDTWFGLQHHSRAKDIVIVEGALDAMWCDQQGVPALALLGSAVSRHKLLRLQSYRSVTLLVDRDSGGAAAANTIGQTLGRLMPLRVATYSAWMQAKDPQELSPVDLELAVARAKPWALWELGKTQRAKRTRVRHND